MELLTIILSIGAIISMSLAVAIGIKNGVKSILVSIILCVFAIEFIFIILRNSGVFNFFWMKFPLLIPSMLLGVLALIHTKIQLSNKLKFKDYYVFCIIALILLFIYLLINKADKSSQIYLVLKFSINFCFIIISLITLNNKEQDCNANINFKKNKRFLIALFVFVIADIANMCLCVIMSKEISLMLFYSVSLFTVIFIGYNELFSNSTDHNSLRPTFKENYCDLVEELDEAESTILPKNNILVNRIILNDERVNEIAVKIDSFFFSNKEFQRDSCNKLINLSKAINEKPVDISYVLKTNYNTNYNNYINFLRIEEAKNIILNNTSNYKIDDIGAMVGFNTKNSFYLAFKKFTGVTPAKYK